jgi:midasin
MKKGQWLLLDEMNLAEPQILERINSLLDDDRNIVLREHDGEIVVPHPDFRLFATMNPVEYQGRKAMSPAFMNRWRIKWIDEMPRDELLDLLVSRFPRIDRGTLRKVRDMHYDIRTEGIEGTLGSACGEFYYYTLRDLLRAANRINCFAAGKADLNELVCCQMKEVYASGLRTDSDRGIFEAILKRYCGDIAVSHREFTLNRIDTEVIVTVFRCLAKANAGRTCRVKVRPW